MRRYEDLSLGHRIAITVVIVLAILFALALFGFLTGGWDKADAQAQQQFRLYEGVPFDAHLLQLDKQALEEAYHQQLLKLFSVWLVSGAPKEAAQFQNGLKIARRAYAQAAEQITRREQELQQPR